MSASHLSSLSSALTLGYLRRQVLLDGGGLQSATTQAARRAISAPLEMIAIATCMLVEGRQLDTDGADGASSAAALTPAGARSARFEAALKSLEPHQAEAASAGGAALVHLAQLVMSGGLQERVAENAPMAATSRLAAVGAAPEAASDLHSHPDADPSNAGTNFAEAQRHGRQAPASGSTVRKGRLARPSSAGALTTSRYPCMRTCACPRAQAHAPISASAFTSRSSHACVAPWQVPLHPQLTHSRHRCAAVTATQRRPGYSCPLRPIHSSQGS